MKLTYYVALIFFIHWDTCLLNLYCFEKFSLSIFWVVHFHNNSCSLSCERGYAASALYKCFQIIIGWFFFSFDIFFFWLSFQYYNAYDGYKYTMSISYEHNFIWGIFFHLYLFVVFFPHNNAWAVWILCNLHFVYPVYSYCK